MLRFLHFDGVQAIVLLGISFFVAFAKEEWSYEGENGIDTWTRLKDRNDRNQCGGRQQSPVDIASDKIKYKAIPPVNFYGYETELRNVTAVINHGSANIANVGRGDRYISGGPLKGRYLVYGFHFHWGRRVDSGSEHTFDGKRYSIELHIVHMKAEYKTFENARNHSDGLAVLAVIFEIGDPWDFPLQSRHVGTWRQDDAEEKLTEIFLALQGHANLTIWKSDISLSDLLPLEPEKYYTYQGSLTTPMCNEAVTWIVFYQRVPIMRELVERFHRLRDKHGVSFPRNWRPTQPLNGRTIYRNFNTGDECSAQNVDARPECPTRFPNRPVSNRPASNRPSSSRPSSSRPYNNRPSSTRPSYDESASTRPSSSRPSNNRPSSSSPDGPTSSYDGPGSSYNRPTSSRPFNNRPSSSKPSYNEPTFPRPTSSGISNDSPSSLRPSHDSPSSLRPSYDRPSSPYDRPTSSFDEPSSRPSNNRPPSSGLPSRPSYNEPASARPNSSRDPYNEPTVTRPPHNRPAPNRPSQYDGSEGSFIFGS